MFRGVEWPYEPIFWIMGIEESDLGEVV
jgi:hypothetical protein